MPRPAWLGSGNDRARGLNYGLSGAVGMASVLGPVPQERARFVQMAGSCLLDGHGLAVVSISSARRDGVPAVKGADGSGP